VDVVVDEPVAVLEVLTLGDAVGRDEQVQLAFVGKLLRTLLREGREGSEDGSQVLAQPGKRGLVAARAGHEGGVDAVLLLRPWSELVIQIMGGIGERSEDDDLTVAGVDRAATLGLDDLAECRQLGVTRSIDLAGSRVERRQSIAVLDEVLLPADEVDVIEQHFDLTANQKALEGGIVDVHIVDIDLFEFLGVSFDKGERGFHVPQLSLYR
jgi:hypothetical protein